MYPFPSKYSYFLLYETENYIGRIIGTIQKWQESDIVYLNSVYPSMDVLFENTAEINGVIFSRSQNDSDFMKISLGTSDEVKPLFEIRSEKKDNILRMRLAQVS